MGAFAVRNPNLKIHQKNLEGLLQKYEEKLQKLRTALQNTKYTPTSSEEEEPNIRTPITKKGEELNIQAPPTATPHETESPSNPNSLTKEMAPSNWTKKLIKNDQVEANKSLKNDETVQKGYTKEELRKYIDIYQDKVVLKVLHPLKAVFDAQTQFASEMKEMDTRISVLSNMFRDLKNK